MNQDGFFSAVLDTAIDGIIIIDDRGSIQRMNRAARELFQYSEQSEYLDQNVSMLMPSPHQHLHDQYLSKYIDTGKAKIIGIGREVQGKRKNGVLFPMRLAVSECFIDNKRFFTGIIHDLTEVYATRFALQKMETRVSEHMAGTEVGRGGSIYSDDLGSARLMHLAEQGERRSYHQGSKIRSAAQDARTLFLLQKGIVKSSQVHEMGKSFVTDCFGPPAVIGLEAVLSNGNYREDYEAVSDIELIEIRKQDLLKSIREDIVLSELLLRSLSATIRKRSEQLTQVAYDRVRDKVLRALKILDPLFRNADNERMAISLGREELSDFAGVARETLTRSLSELKKEGLISIRQNDILILKDLVD